jgi:D-alanyl-D-alanine carboxypeptidase/D-alanyl-D-alanine-endopeptidase (penicillin-binding protein 4)
VLGRLGIDTTGETILDGSGLSRHDRLHPDTLLAVIETASSDKHPELRPVVVDLPVAGFTGSLTYRFETGNPEGLGTVRAKTGTLTGVHGLAGTVTSADGTLMSFVAVADKVKPENTLDARAKLDEIAAALAGCSCAKTEPSASATP